MAYKNIMFDLDGTLTDSSEGINKSVLYVYDKMGIAPPSKEELRTFIGPPLGDSFTRHGIAESDRDKCVAIFRERYNTIGKFENVPYPGMIELLERLKNAGFKLYVATSKPEKTALEVLSHFDMVKYFDEIAGATMDRSREKKEDVIAYLLEKTGGNKDSVVMIGDSIYDVVGAKEFGIPCIGVSWGFGDLIEMKSGGAVAIVDTMDELFAELNR